MCITGNEVACVFPFWTWGTMGPYLTRNDIAKLRLVHAIMQAACSVSHMIFPSVILNFRLLRVIMQAACSFDAHLLVARFLKYYYLIRCILHRQLHIM
jgi:hypothetical protein